MEKKYSALAVGLVAMFYSSGCCLKKDIFGGEFILDRKPTATYQLKDTLDEKPRQQMNGLEKSINDYSK